MSARGKKAAAKGVDIMIRHILFWNYTDNVKAQHKEEETLKFLQNSVDTMNGHIDGRDGLTSGASVEPPGSWPSSQVGTG